ncbi:hypothetical protein A9Q74_17555 [Colwellia sp. 39_35_sub15_T18]|nr:hypothetical protein A9Q74_17555 [Colwellia sp. 39_35_sub15_T18]
MLVQHAFKPDLQTRPLNNSFSDFKHNYFVLFSWQKIMSAYHLPIKFNLSSIAPSCLATYEIAAL